MTAAHEGLLDQLIHAVRSHERSPDKYTAQEIADARAALADHWLASRAESRQEAESVSGFDIANRNAEHKATDYEAALRVRDRLRKPTDCVPKSVAKRIAAQKGEPYPFEPTDCVRVPRKWVPWKYGDQMPPPGTYFVYEERNDPGRYVLGQGWRHTNDKVLWRHVVAYFPVTIPDYTPPINRKFDTKDYVWGTKDYMLATKDGGECSCTTPAFPLRDDGFIARLHCLACNKPVSPGRALAGEK